jgi:hypothetical protein
VARRRAARRERRLRATVRRLRACLGGLGRLERRVLVLRTGVAGGRARSRQRVARLLDLSTRRVRRLERRGLRHLRALCAGRRVTPAAGAVDGAAPPFGAAVFGGLGGTTLLASAGGGKRRSGAVAAPRDRAAVKGQRQSSSPPPPKLAPPRVPPGGFRESPGGGSGFSLTLQLLVLLGAVLLILVMRGVRR